MKRYCLALDLKDDPQLIEQYVQHHRAVWPEIQESITSAGIQQMEIYLRSNRLFMIIEANDDFSFDRKAEADKADPKVQAWESLMWKYQKPLPNAPIGEKWLPMDLIFSLSEQAKMPPAEILLDGAPISK